MKDMGFCVPIGCVSSQGILGKCTAAMFFRTVNYWLGLASRTETHHVSTDARANAWFLLVHKLATFPHVKQAQENKTYASAVTLEEIGKLIQDGGIILLVLVLTSRWFPLVK